MNGDCHNLDAYLADDLSAHAFASFAAHLAGCNECRTAIDEQRWIDGLLCSSAHNALEQPRGTVLVSVRDRIAAHRRRRNAIACGLATAAAIVVAAGWIALSRQVDDRAVGEVKSAPVAPEDTSQATFIAGSNAIAVPLASHHADVTVIRVYSAFQPRADAFTAVGEQTETSYENSWQDNSNGG